MKILLIVLMVLAPVLIAQTVLFEDDFSDGDADGWTEWNPDGTYEVNEDLRYQLSYPGVEDVDPVVARGDVDDIYMSTNNYSARAKIIAHSPTSYSAIGVRLSEGLQGYVAYLRYVYNDVCIFRHLSENSYVDIGSAACGDLNFDEPYWLRFKCEDDLFMVKVWQGQSYEEPDEWLLIVSDATYSNNGCMVLAAANSGTGACDVEFDNVQVIGYPTSLDQSTWAGIKSGF